MPHLAAWERIGAPPFVLDQIHDGVPLTLCGSTVPGHFFAKNRVASPQAKQFVTGELKCLCDLGYIVLVNWKP